MQKTIPLLALCAMFAGCSLYACGGHEKDGPIPAGGLPCPETALRDNDWWHSSIISATETPRRFGWNPKASGIEHPGIHTVSTTPTQFSDVLPPDLNKGKSFWEPRREFDYLFENYEYPDHLWWRDLADMPSALWKDTRHLLRPRYLVILGMGAALAGGARTMDHDIADHFEDTDVLGGGEDFGNVLGHPGLHLGIARGIYLYGRLSGNKAALERGLILCEGLIINDLATLALKAAFNRERPSGDNLSFPSGHVSSTFALAAMLDEMYGHRVGYPMYLLGGFVAFSRMSDEEHYLSDTVFAAFLGYAIGKAVFDRHRVEMFGFELQPYIEERTGAFGLSLSLDL